MNVGVVLPADALGAVSARDDLRYASVTATSVRALAFATLTDATGGKHQAADATIRAAGVKKQLLLQPLTINPATRKPYAAVQPAVGTTLRVLVGSESRVGLFAGGSGSFDPRGVLLTDQLHDDAIVTALVDWADGKPGKSGVETLFFDGDGGSVDTYTTVRNIESTGPLGDVLLRAGKKGGQVLQSLQSPSMFGKLNLFGGRFADVGN